VLNAAPAGRRAGFTIVELVITLALFGVLLALGIPAFTTFIQNAQIRNAAEHAVSGLNLARAESVQRNAPIRFQFVSNLTASCTVSTASGSWVISLDDPEGLCDVAPSETTAPRILQKYTQQEGAAGVTANTAGGGLVIFSGLGRVSGAGTTQIDFSRAGSVCEHVDAAGSVRCLRVLISTGGAIRLCDPKVAAATDPRHCS
jgi:type IV fimbrial biogenesis protein FimT